MYSVTGFLLGVPPASPHPHLSPPLLSHRFFKLLAVTPPPDRGTPKRNGATEHMGFFLEIGSNILDFLYSKVAKANY